MIAFLIFISSLASANHLPQDRSDPVKMVSSGGEVGNGGDSVFCEKSAANKYEGLFSLDFLLTLQTDNSDLITVRSWEESRDRFRKLLGQKYPELGLMLEDFFAGNPFVSKPDSAHKYIQRRIWDEAPYGLIDVKDERIIRKLPANCYKLKAPDEINVVQSIIRHRADDVLIYDFDPENLTELRDQKPLQFSFLLMHEFLWDFTDDISVVRRADRFLHSKNLETLSSEQVKLSLDNIGIKFRRFPQLSVCDRTKEVRLAFEKYFKADCRDIEMQKLASTVDLNMQGMGIAAILPWDLAGIKKTMSINLSDNLLTELFDDTFYDMEASYYGQVKLNLSGNRLSLRSWGFLKPFTTMNTLDLSNNELGKLPTDYQYLPRIFALHLEGNHLQELPTEMIKALCNYPIKPTESNGLYIFVRGNPAQSVSKEAADYCRTRNYGLVIEP